MAAAHQAVLALMPQLQLRLRGARGQQGAGRVPQNAAQTVLGTDNTHTLYFMLVTKLII